MAANTNANEIINKIKNNPAPIILEQKELSREMINKIKNNPASVILEQQELSEATVGILGSYLRGLRMSRGVLNKFDEKEQNAQMVRELKYISEHNYMLFLVLTGQYDRIREIFFDKDLFGRELALIEEIEREEARAAAKVQQQTPFFDPLKPQTTTANTLAASTSYTPRDYSPFFTQGVTNMDLYRHYEQEHRRVSYAHYTAQTKVLDKAHHGRTGRMMQIHDASEHEHIRREIKELHQRYTEEHNAIMTRSTVHSDGSPDVHAAKQQYEELLALDHKYEKAFASFLKKHEKEPGFEKAYQQELKETQRYKEELENNDKIYAEKLSEITPHLERANQAAKANIEENLNALIDDVGALPFDLLNKGQQQELNSAVSRLTELKEQVKNADSLEQKEELLAKCSQEVEIIKRIAYPLMSGQLKKQFEKDVEMFQKIAKDQDMLGLNAQSSANLNAVPIQEPHENVGAAVEQEPGPNEMGEYESGVETAQDPNVNSKLGHEINGSNHDITSIDVDQSLIEAQRRLKMSLHMSRNVINGSHIIVDEDKKVIDSALTNIAKDIKSIAPSIMALDDEDKMILAKIGLQIDEIKQYKKIEDLPDVLVESISSNIAKLAGNHEDFAGIQEKFAVVSELMEKRDEYSARQSVHI